jgi:hypothetical protein
MRCTHCHANPMPEHLGICFSPDGDPFCDFACKDAHIARMRREIARISEMSDEEFHDYMGHPMHAIPQTKTNWKRDGF